MIEFGKSLRAAREAKGYSIRQLAEMTRMAPTTVQELESENFSRIAAPIYGRGFVKLYCKAVGLDQNLFIDEFMDLYSGNRETVIRERPPAAPSPANPPPPPPPPVDKKPDPDPEPDLFRQPQPTEESEEPKEGLAQTPHGQTLSRYASPIRHNNPIPDLRRFLRVGLLAAIAVTFLILLGFGIRAVYRATTSAKPAEAGEQTPSDRQPVTPSAAARTVRMPQKIPSLYID